MVSLTQRAINDFYPGTKLAITEYDFYGRTNISGTIAQADALGIFGKTGVYYATYFGIADQYIAPAFKLYRNYDGTNKTFGDISVASSTSNNALTSIYASIDDNTANTMHVVLINKNTVATTAQITISGTAIYTSIFDAYGITEADGNNLVTAKSKLNATTSSTAITGNALSYVMQPKSAYHLVLKTSTTTTIPENTNQASFILAPNPAQDEITFTAKSIISTIKITDISGRLVLESKPTLTSVVSLPIQQLAKGIYIVEVKTENNEVMKQKLIID
jgi:Secretion system C-terminal sorting domain